MRPGRHAAEDGSFGRSAGIAAGRGALLLAVAVVLGVVLLNAADDTPGRVSAGHREERTDTAEEAPPPTTAEPPPTTAAPRPPREVKVLSANGTKVNGAAGRVRDTLRARGYNVLAPVEAKPANASAVHFTPGYERDAQAVAEVLKLAPTAVQPLPDPPPLADVRGANVVVVVGPDLARPAGTTTTTGGRARTTTTTARPKG
ncbi:MAG: LytR C-terminal domain-containing protein [Actinomycetota bacterium]|nr:LytR C-terminal domain-containing protein [Actinomycetota bacterium]